MSRELAFALVLVILALAFAGMYLGWRARQRRQSALPEPAEAPDDLGAIRAVFDGLYVATTLSGQPLERVAVRGLGFRSRARLTVADAGVLLALQGERDVFVPLGDLVRASRETWTIDRVVEDGGLVMVTWALGDTLLDSYVRTEATAEAVAALTELITPESEKDA